MKASIFVALLGAVTTAYACADEQPVVIAYFTSWSIYGRGYSPADIPAKKITHLNYAFAKIVDNKIALADPFADVEKAYPGDKARQPFKGNMWQINKVIKGKNPHLKTLISVGGWTMSTNFSAMAATNATRKVFAKSCAEFVQKYNFDGVDIDWEYPVSGGDTGMKHSPADRENFSLLMAELRRALGPKRLLTAAVAASPALVKNLNLDTLEPSVDFLNVMAYDFYVAGASNFTAPQSNLYGMKGSEFSVDLAIKSYMKEAFPPKKLVLGIPYYGRAYANVTRSALGLFQSFKGPAAGTFEPGALNYYNITQDIQSLKLKEFWDNKAKTSWAYNRDGKLFVAYDNKAAVRTKCQYVINKGLAGVMMWELSQEGMPGKPRDTPLTDVIQQSFAGSKKPSIVIDVTKKKNPAISVVLKNSTLINAAKKNSTLIDVVLNNGTESDA